MHGNPKPPALAPLSPAFAATRDALHRLAERIVAPARKPDNEISLRVGDGWWGTPPFEHGDSQWQVRVEGPELVVERDGGVRRGTIGSLAGAADLVGTELLPAGPVEGDAELEVDPLAAAALADWFGFGAAVLEQLRSDASGDDEPTIVRLWPEHFDVAIESGSEAAGLRANYGASPGDSDHEEPYLYVGPWSAEISGDMWAATGFSGAELLHSQIVPAGDQFGIALEFARSRRAALRAG